MRACILKNTKRKINNLLDVGCGDGYITGINGKYLGLNPSNIHCLNLKDEDKKPSSYHPGVTYKDYYANQNYPYKNNSFSVVVYSMVLRYVSNLEHNLKEAYRILQKGGFLLIREVDAPTDFDKMIADINNRTFSKYKDYESIISYCDYTSWIELNYKITSVISGKKKGFFLKKILHTTTTKNAIENIPPKYFALYQKDLF